MAMASARCRNRLGWASDIIERQLAHRGRSQPPLPDAKIESIARSVLRYHAEGRLIPPNGEGTPCCC